MDRKKIITAGLVLLLAAPVIYVVVQIAMILHNPYTTQTAIQYTLTDGMLLDGVVSFEEQEVAGNGHVGYLVKNGERVSAGAQVGELYSSIDQARSRARLKNLEHQVEILKNSQNASGIDIGVHLGQSQAAVYDLLETLDRRQFGQLQESQDQYLTANNKLQVITGKQKDFSGALEKLAQQKEVLEAAVGAPLAVTAPAGGYFVTQTQSKFLNVPHQELEEASPAQMQELLQKNLERPAGGAAGKVVTSYHWRFYSVCTAEESERFEVGNKVGLSFPEQAETPLPAKVVAVDVDKETGMAKIVIECDYVNSDVLALGQETAKVDFASYHGLRISTDALHIVDGKKGVYVKHSNAAKFRKIKILYQNEDYMLVPQDGWIGGESEVRLFDEVIVQGSDLEDEKML